MDLDSDSPGSHCWAVPSHSGVCLGLVGTLWASSAYMSQVEAHLWCLRLVFLGTLMKQWRMWYLRGQGGAHGALDGLWSSWCLWSNGSDGSWMQCMIAGWTRWITWHSDGDIGAQSLLVQPSHIQWCP